MDFEEFREKLRNDLPGVLPEDMQNVSIDFQHTEKLQNGSCEGIVVKPEEQNVVINIDMVLYSTLNDAPFFTLNDAVMA